MGIKFSKGFGDRYFFFKGMFFFYVEKKLRFSMVNEKYFVLFLFKFMLGERIKVGFGNSF